MLCPIKCVYFSLAIPAAKLFTREMNAAISRGLRSFRPLQLSGKLREEITYWLFLDSCDEPLPWREERHTLVKVATDASALAWGVSVLSPKSEEFSDYWTTLMDHRNVVYFENKKWI